MSKNMLKGFLSLFAVAMLAVFVSVPKIDAATPTTKKWTFAVYLDADNNLEDAGIADFLEMAKGVSSSDVNIVVQMDRASGYDTTNDNWTTCKRGIISKGDKPNKSWGTDIKEVNMGSQATLKDFIKWTKDNYPAEKYALVLWNHGGGWRDRSMARSPMDRAVCWDEGNGDACLYMKDVREAIAGSAISKFDLIGFDACLMGHIEVAYELKNVLTSDGVMVGSEETEPGEGWPYDTILPNLKGTTSAEDLGKAIVDKYGAYYGSKAECTQAAAKAGKIADVAAKLNAFADAMNDNGSADVKLKAIQKARTSMKAFSEADGYFGLDIYKFADLVASNASGTAAKDLKDAIDSAMVDVYAGTARQGSYSKAGKGGLCVYFPKSKSDYDTAYDSKILYGSETAGKWNDFLKRYYAGNLGTGGSTGGGTTDNSSLAVTATLSKKSVVRNTKYASMTYTLKLTAGSLAGGKVKVLIPTGGWQSPQNSKPKGEGYVKAYIYKSGSKAYPLTTAVSGQEIVISGIPSTRLIAKNGDQLKLAYYKFYTKQTASTAVFRTFTAVSGGNFVEIEKNPTIKVGASKLAIGDEDVDEENVTEDGEAKKATLGQNYPNPFNPSTTFNYYLEEGGRVNIKLYNVAGQEVDTVIDQDQVAGDHAIQYDSGDKLSRGVYYYRMTLNGKEIGTKRAVVLK